MSTLDGPPHDVRSLRDTLVNRWGFQPQNIEMLIDSQSTRQSILDALSRLRDRTRAGDELFFYFSGHGTSDSDPRLGKICSDVGSGCLVPYDASRGDPISVANSLIGGRRDLRPLLTEIDLKNPATLFVVFDACYAENSSKTIRSVTARALPFDIMTGNPTKDLVFERLPDGILSPSRERAEPYPYKNVIFISSSAKDEKALDISQNLLDSKDIKTLDNRPHGYFTNELLKALAGEADLNNDKSISYFEVFQFAIQQLMGLQSPQFKTAGGSALAGKPVFGVAAAPGNQPRTAAAPLVRVRLGGEAAKLRPRLEKLAGVSVVSTSADLVVLTRGDAFELSSGSGLVVRSYRPSEVDDLVHRIAAEPGLRRFVRGSGAAQGFNAALQLKPEDRGIFQTGDQITFVMSADRECHFLLVNIDTAGMVRVIYPNRSIPAKPTKRLEVNGTVFGPPTGAEYVKLIAFTVMPAGFAQWSDGEFDTHSARFTELAALLNHPNAAAASIVMYSAPRTAFSAEPER